MLYSKLKRYVVKTPLGDKVGKVEDIIFNGETWKVEYIVISEGFLKKTRIGVKPEDVKIDDENEAIIVSPEVEHIEISSDISSIHRIFFSDFKRKGVLSSDDVKAGHVYDIDVATQLKRWEVWKILIDTGWKNRRLRIRPEQIKALGEDLIIDLTREDIERLSKPELPQEEE